MTSEALPDLLAPELKVVFVGTGAGRRSATLGTYYAGPGNRFWSTLYEVGLTPRTFEPQEFRELLPLGMGLTDISKTSAGMDDEIADDQFNVEAFGEKMQRLAPARVAFTSKKAAAVWLAKDTRHISYGRQNDLLSGQTEIFVLPSTSGAARSSWDLAPWQELSFAINGS